MSFFAYGLKSNKADLNPTDCLYIKIHDYVSSVLDIVFALVESQISERQRLSSCKLTRSPRQSPAGVYNISRIAVGVSLKIAAYVLNFCII